MVRKPIHSVQRKWIFKKLYRYVKDLFHEFCSSTTIHGMAHVGTGKSSLPVKLGWLIVCILSMFCCGLLIRKVYDKWESSPVIVSLDDSPTPVWKIPLPAVTICPEDKISSRVMNFAEDFDEFFYGNGNMSQLRKDQLMVALQVCDKFFIKHKTYYEKFSNDSLDVMKLLRRVMTKPIICPIDNEHCSANLFTETLTELGICFTYNGFSSKDMFYDGVLHDEYKLLSETSSAVNWSMEGGYKPGTPFITYPLRGVQHTSGRCNFNLASEKSDIEAHCTEGKGFKLILHSPDEYPMAAAKSVLLSLDMDIDISITPQIMTTSKELASYPPDRRKCLFNHERQLKFFRVYNQNNCIMECFANLTLARCGCVRFAMPRSAGTRICRTAELRCVLGTQRRMLEMIMESQVNSDSSMSFCNCMSACNSIEFNTDITQSAYDYMETIELRLKKLHFNTSNLTTNIRSSKVSIHFKAAEFLAMRRGELFGLTDFIANCGGVLGLCLGVSFVSLVELLYYCVIRPLMLLVKNSVDGRSRKVVVMVRASGERVVRF